MNHIDSPVSSESSKNLLNLLDESKTNDNNKNIEESLKNQSHNDKFGYENMVFEIDNRCDDQKICEPIRFCSLASFVEDGGDIIRKSFKVSRTLTCLFFLFGKAEKVVKILSNENNFLKNFFKSLTKTLNSLLFMYF